MTGDQLPSGDFSELRKPNAYYKTKNIKALSSLINSDNPSNSKLLLKAANKVKHRGAKEVVLNPVQVGELQDALAKWIYWFEPQRKQEGVTFTSGGVIGPSPGISLRYTPTLRSDD